MTYKIEERREAGEKVCGPKAYTNGKTPVVRATCRNVCGMRISSRYPAGPKFGKSPGSKIKSGWINLRWLS